MSGNGKGLWDERTRGQKIAIVIFGTIFGVILIFFLAFKGVPVVWREIKEMFTTTTITEEVSKKTTKVEEPKSSEVKKENSSTTLEQRLTDVEGQLTGLKNKPAIAADFSPIKGEIDALKAEKVGLEKRIAALEALTEKCSKCVDGKKPPPKANKNPPRPKADLPKKVETLSAAPAPTASSAPAQRYWLWHPKDATEEKPAHCIIEGGSGAGLPPYCKSFTVRPRQTGDDKCKWMGRESGIPTNCTDTGLYQKQ